MTEVMGYVWWLVCHLVVKRIWVVEADVGMYEEEGATVYCVMLGEAAAFVDPCWGWVGAGCVREGVGYKFGMV